MSDPYRFETIKDAGDGHPSIQVIAVTHEEWLAAQDEMEQLRRWKVEATAVLARWDRVWMLAGCPGPLGASKADSVYRFINDMIDDPE